MLYSTEYTAREIPSPADRPRSISTIPAGVRANQGEFYRATFLPRPVPLDRGDRKRAAEHGGINMR